MRIFDKYWPKASIVEQLKQQAGFLATLPSATASQGLSIVQKALSQYEQPGLVTTLIYTRDEGMHSVGWWKNPDYARCWHLSLAFWYPDRSVAPRQNKASLEWVELFFRPNENWVWSEPAYSGPGKKKGVWHYRLFADANWQPIKPEGEVYSTLKTEKGWLSWSDVQYQIKQEEAKSQ